MTHEPTELQIQAGTMTVLADLTRAAAKAGATAPRWFIPENSLVDGTLWSDDDSAIEALHVWRRVIGAHRLSTYTFESAGQGRRRIWSVQACVDGVSIHLRSNTPEPTLVELPASDQPTMAVAA